MGVREKLRRLVKEAIHSWEPDVNMSDHIVDNLITHGVTVQEWISVEDRLPEKYRDECGELIPFLVCESGTEYPCRALFDGKKWGDGVFPIPVTHWMPLPQPPKGE